MESRRNNLTIWRRHAVFMLSRCEKARKGAYSGAMLAFLQRRERTA